MNIELNKDDLCTLKVPMRFKNKKLMSPGTWNGYYYSPEELHKAFTATEWSNEARGMFLDHKDTEVTNWVGMIENQHMVGHDLFGDLVVLDLPTARKLKYGAKFGISPKVEGEGVNGAIKDFTYENFSVVVKPAVKTNYINSALAQEVDTMELTDIEILEVTSNSDWTDFVKEYRTKNPDATLKDVAAAFKKLSDPEEEKEEKESTEMMDAITKLSKRLEDMDAKITKLEEVPEPEKTPEEVEKPEETEETEETVENAEEDEEDDKKEETEEMSKDIKTLTTEPVEKVTVKSAGIKELSMEQLDKVMLKGMLTEQGNTDLARQITI